ncbi:peptide chain release factor N(5)-glutamine methyltransferase [bacterium (Candidatus Howlettbacteria) CG_4_10_14_0_8_um_filter_40_9]|nr:MAG: peptide chain release factor N(5)-glutamine methyltransferase [bacterium (Candidatus Howlettbacteria) CG_4_10_14_0_8_um_filter_40_9]
MIIKEGLSWAIDELKKNDVSESEGSATLLLANVLKKDRTYIYAHGEEKLSTKQSDLFKKYIKRRKTHEPVWYILSEVEFYGRKFYVNNDVLTPRPETEILLQEVLKSISNIQFPISNVIELGTGSGIIVITLAEEIKKIKIIATDISDKTLKVAKKNAKLHGVEKQIEFFEGDLLSPITNNKLRFTNTILVANLPYIPHEDMESLQFDVLHHEPRVALDGGKQGIEIYERLLKQMKESDFTGMAFFEIGIGQGKLIKKIVQKYFPKVFVEIKKDLADIDRIMIIEIKA